MRDAAARGRTDTASLVVAAQPDAVYRAFAEPGALMAWLPPDSMTGRVLDYDFREGGRYSIELTYDEAAPDGVGKTTGRTDVSAGRFLSLEPGKRIVQSVAFESSDASFAGEMVMTWSFEALPAGTRITITAENVPPGISQADHDAGLRASLENLARYLSGGSRSIEDLSEK
ncbi:SRPBCC domain-containing protein [Sorangium sp. So ce233]|uniref:SRPBCC domain-containing protein n=1 Tax=Sorangium sp. So ce233 TaxID=3133290 RepID=UPI003F6411D3